MILKQIRHTGDNFSYIIADEAIGEAAVVDPGYNTAQIIKVVRDEGLRLAYVIATHHHADHAAGVEELRRVFGSKVVAHRNSSVRADIAVDDGSELFVGNVKIRVIYTPGHTRDGICLLAGGALLTGDTLFVGECGRTDLPDGDPGAMYESLFGKLMTLDDGVEVFPGHDYGRMPSSTIGQERRNNYTLKERSRGEFIEFMKEP